MRHVQDNAERCMRRAIRRPARRSFRLRNGQRPAHRRAHRGRRRRRHRTDRFLRHVTAAGQQFQRPACGHDRGRAVRVPHAHRRTDPAQCGLPAPTGHRRAGGLDARPGRARRGGGGQRRDVAMHRGCAVWRARAAGSVAGHDEQFHVRQRAVPVLRDDRGWRRRRAGIRWRERRSDAHDQLAPHRPGSARSALPGAAA